MNKFLVTFVVIFGCQLPFAASAKSPISHGKTAIVMIDKNPSGFDEYLNFRMPAKGMFDALVNLHKEGVAHVAMIVHEDASLKSVMNLRKLLAKADWPGVRIFYFDRHKEWLQEVSYSGVYVYSENVDNLVPLH